LQHKKKNQKEIGKPNRQVLGAIKPKAINRIDTIG
jgi:hypothetical protein